jgi:hypothetical protein
VEDAIFVGQDDLPHGQGALIEPLLRCGLLIPAQPAKATICEGCERCCIMAVQFAPPRPGHSARGFIVCDKRDDIGRVAVPSEGLRRWATSWQGIARLLAKVLGIVGEPIQVDARRHWLLGSVNRGGKSVEVALLRSGQEVASRTQLAIVLTDPGQGIAQPCVAIGQAIAFRHGEPVVRKRAIEGALSSRFGDPTVVCEIRFVAGDIVFVNHVTGRQRPIASPHFNSSNDNAFQVLYDNPGKKFSLKELRAAANEPAIADLHKMVENLGFGPPLKKLFFRVSRAAICFDRAVALYQVLMIMTGRPSFWSRWT